MPPRKPGDPRATTRAGYAIPHEPLGDDVPTTVQGTGGAPAIPTPAFGVASEGAVAPKSVLGMIEVEYLQEPDLTNIRGGSIAMFEIWTRNRIYHVDAELKCIAVLSRATLAPESGHSLLGAKLTGGERRSKSSAAIEIYYPLPMPGTEAVFRSELKRHGQYGHTSTIERVVLRVRKVRVGSIDTATSWDEITGRFVAR